MPKKIISSKTGTESGKEKRKKNLVMWKKGQSGNPKGAHVGQRPYLVIYKEALKSLAKKKGVTPEELEELIEQVGIAKAMSGDYRFFQDFRDRVHGKAIQRSELTGANGRDLIPDAAGKKGGDELIDEFINGSKK